MKKEKKEICFVTFDRIDKKRKLIENPLATSLRNGFQIVYLEYQNRTTKKFRPIGIIYTPVRKQDDIINLYFSYKFNFSQRAIYIKNKKKKHFSVWQCCFCSTSYLKKVKFVKVQSLFRSTRCYL